VKTARLNAAWAAFTADHVVVLGDTQDVYERVFLLCDKVGAAYVGAHEKAGSQAAEYQARLAGRHDSLSRAASAHLDFVKAVAGVRAELRREIAKECGAALRDILAMHQRRLALHRRVREL
jgi:hypothetical protein